MTCTHISEHLTARVSIIDPDNCPWCRIRELEAAIDWANRNGLLTLDGQPRGHVSNAIATVIKESLDRIAATTQSNTKGKV